MMCGKIDFVIRAQKPICKPQLFLAAKAARTARFDHLRRKVIMDPVRRLAQKRHRPNAGFFLKLAPRSGQGIFARINAALRELPVIRRGRACSLTEPNLTRRVKDDNADTRTVNSLRHGLALTGKGRGRSQLKTAPLQSADPLPRLSDRDRIGRALAKRLTLTFGGLFKG